VEEAVVEIGIPTWGTSRYLAATVEAVLAQTHQAWRLAISHDGPEGDDAFRCVEPYLGDTRIRYSARERRLGAAGNKTWLINQGTGPFVALLDHDDLWDETFLESRVRFLTEHADCGFVFASMRVIDGNGDELKRWNVRLEPGVQERAAFVERLLGQNLIGASSALVRRTAYESLGSQFDERFPRTYDYEMWVRLALAFPVGVLPEFDAALRTHPDQSTGDLTGLEEEYSSLVEHIWKLVHEEAPAVHLGRRSKRRKVASLLLTGVLNAIERDQRRTAFRYLVRALRIDPLSVFDVRTPSAALAIPLGSTGKRAINGARSFAHNRGIRLRL
jgi:hypothetical protein